MIRPIAALALVAALAGCESLTDAECQSADWYQIGVRDGSEGRAPDFVEAHQRACASAGIAPDVSRWMEGRERGLRLYCTPAKAYQVGRGGGSVRPGCTPAEMQALSAAYQKGAAYWRVELQIRDIESDLREIDRDLASLPPTESAMRARLYAERARLSSQLTLLQLEQRRYASWP